MIRWTVAAILFFVTLVMVKLPAQFALYLAPLPKEIQIFGVDGTVWAGKAQAVSYQGQRLESVKWRLNLLPLLSGSVELELNAGTRRSPIKLSGVVGVNGSGWLARNVSFKAPVALINEFYPVPATLSGHLEGKILEASQGMPWCNRLMGDVSWVNPEVNSPMMGQALKLDDTQAQLSCDQGGLVAQISDAGSVLGLNVTASLGKKDYLVTGEMKPGSGFPSQFKQGLMFVASPISGGRYQIDLSGSL